MTDRSRRLLWALAHISLVMILALVCVKLMPGASDRLAKNLWYTQVRDRHIKRVNADRRETSASPTAEGKTVTDSKKTSNRPEPEVWDPKTQALPPGMVPASGK